MAFIWRHEPDAFRDDSCHQTSSATTVTTWLFSFLNCCFFSKCYFVIFFSPYFLNAKIRCTLFARVWRPTFWSVAAALQMCGELREIAKYIYLNLFHVQIFVVILSLFSSRCLWCAALAKRFKVKWMKWIFIFPDLLKNYLHSLLWLLLWRIVSSGSVNVIFFFCPLLLYT